MILPVFVSSTVYSQHHAKGYMHVFNIHTPATGGLLVLLPVLAVSSFLFRLPAGRHGVQLAAHSWLALGCSNQLS